MAGAESRSSPECDNAGVGVSVQCPLCGSTARRISRRALDRVMNPSGVAEPSRADELLTQSLKQALTLVDIRTLDHFIVAGSQLVSFAERGLI